MNILDGLRNFLQMVNDNWATIVAILSLSFAIYKKVDNYFKKSKEEQQAIIDDQIKKAKIQISETILKLISDAEEDYQEWIQAGEIKRAQVIGDIYAQYPILDEVVNQEELILWIDEEIDNALVELRKIIEKNKENKLI